MSTRRILISAIPMIVLSILMIAAAFLIFTDIAVNGALASPAQTFAALAVAGVGLLATNMLTIMITTEIVTESRARI